MLRKCVIDFKGNWDKHMLVVEFFYNNIHHSSINMDPFEAIYGRRFRSMVGRFHVDNFLLLVSNRLMELLRKFNSLE